MYQTAAKHSKRQNKQRQIHYMKGIHRPQSVYQQLRVPRLRCNAYSDNFFTGNWYCDKTPAYKSEFCFLWDGLYCKWHANIWFNSPAFFLLLNKSIALYNSMPTCMVLLFPSVNGTIDRMLIYWRLGPKEQILLIQSQMSKRHIPSLPSIIFQDSPWGYKEIDGFTTHRCFTTEMRAVFQAHLCIYVTPRPTWCIFGPAWYLDNKRWPLTIQVDRYIMQNLYCLFV